jgi:hypothetical protein
MVLSYLLNNSGEDGGCVSVLRTLTHPPPPFFEKIRSINKKPLEPNIKGQNQAHFTLDQEVKVWLILSITKSLETTCSS